VNNAEADYGLGDDADRLARGLRTACNRLKTRHQERRVPLVNNAEADFGHGLGDDVGRSGGRRSSDAERRRCSRSKSHEEEKPDN
jgi:hypothetical protein